MRVVSDHRQVDRRPYLVTDDMTFGHLIAAACLSDHLSVELLNNWYLVDENKGGLWLRCSVIRSVVGVSNLQLNHF